MRELLGRALELSLAHVQRGDETPGLQALVPQRGHQPIEGPGGLFPHARWRFRFSTSVGGSLTGMGGSLIIVDDALKPDEAYSTASRQAVNSWFDRTARSRLNNKAEDAIIVIAQRLHAEDLCGHLRRQGGWGILSLPAIAEADEIIPLGNGRVHHRRTGDVLDPQRDNQAVLDEMHSVGSASFSAQHQQRPIPPEGEIVKFAWFSRYETVPMPPQSRIVQSWDTAIKVTASADYSVCLTFSVLEQFLTSLNR
jgi:hypothetical protein